MQDDYKAVMLGRLSSPVLSVRNQVCYRLEALGPLLDSGVDLLEIADAMQGIEVKPSPSTEIVLCAACRVAQRDHRWMARSMELAPELSVAGHTADEAKRNLVLRLRHYDPDE